jgi:hypothetical protein
MDLDSILAKAGAAPAPPADPVDDADLSFLKKRPKGGGMDLDAILAKAGAAPAPDATAGPDRIGAANSDYAANVAGLKTDAAAIPTAGQQARQIPIVGSILKANDVAANAMVHPVDTVNAIRQAPVANLREGLRGVNDNIPFANRAVEAMGGPPAESVEDQAAAVPGMRDFGGVVGLPAANWVGGIAGKGIEAAAPLVDKTLGRVARSVGEKARDIQATRAADQLEVKVNKGTRAGLRSDAVRAATADYPALRRAAAAGDDAKVADVTAAMHQEAGAQLRRIYTEAKVAPESIAAPIEFLDKRIDALKGTEIPSDTAAAVELQKIRDKLNASLSTEGASNPAKLRAIQSDYQRAGYAKNINSDPEVTARIRAAREASKAVGDAVLQHVTGMDYAAAKAAAAANPNGLEARLFKANDTISAANKIDASIADRAGRAQPKKGVFNALVNAAKHPIDTGINAAAAIPSYAGRKTLDLTAKLADLRAGRGGTPTGPLIGEAASWAGDAKAPTPPAPPTQPQRPTQAQAVAVARLLQAARAGATRQQLEAQAQQDGTPPELAANIAMQFGR